MLYTICTNVTTLSVKVIIISVVRFAGAIRIVVTRGAHGQVQSGFNLKIQPNRKIAFLVNITQIEPRTGSNRIGFIQFGLVF